MKKFLLASAMIASVLTFTSCSEQQGENPFEITGSGITGVHTTTPDDYRSWAASTNISFTTSNSTMSSWTIIIGKSSGTFYQVTPGDEAHWQGAISYTEKKKVGDFYYYETTTDRIYVDLFNTEAGWNEVTFRTMGYYTDKYNNETPTGMNNHYVIRTERGGDFNVLGVYNTSDQLQFKFVTNETDNFNNWKTDGMENNWLGGQARATMLLVPMLISIHQM